MLLFFSGDFILGPDISLTNHQPPLCFIIHVRQSSQTEASFPLAFAFKWIYRGIHQATNLPNELWMTVLTVQSGLS